MDQWKFDQVYSCHVTPKVELILIYMYTQTVDQTSTAGTRALRLQVVLLSPSPPGVMVKKKPHTQGKMAVRNYGDKCAKGGFLLSHASHPQVFIHVTHNGLSEERLQYS